MEKIMTLKFNTDYATNTGKRIVSLIDGNLTMYKDGANVVLVQPFAIDFGTMTHGYVKLKKGTKPQYMLQAMDKEFSAEDNTVMVADGWQYMIAAKIMSEELGKGLWELHDVNSAPLTKAIATLYETFLKHAPEGSVPMVTHETNEIGEQSFAVHGFASRPGIFGTPCNTFPTRDGPLPPLEVAPTPIITPLRPTLAPAAASANGSKQTDLLATLAARKAKQAAAAIAEEEAE